MKRFTTVVVTVHNSERCLRQCLDSIIGQTQRGIEILCIDDASTDSSHAIMAEYAAKDERIRCHRFDVNGGVQRSRNTAMAMAKGDFIIYVDDDDWISPDCVENCLECFERYDDVDCVLIPEKRVRADGTVYDPEGRVQFDSITGEQAFMHSMPWHVAGNFFTSLEYQRSHPFDDSCRYFGDENTGRLMLLDARRVVLSKGMYYYRQTEGSVCHSVGIGQYSRLHAQRILAQTLQEKNVNLKMQRAYETFCWENVICAYMRYYKERGMMDKDLRCEALKMIMQAREEMDMKLVESSLKRKFGFMQLSGWPWLFRMQEEVYFTLRTLLGRMDLDVD